MNKPAELKIDKRKVGPGHPVFIIAEMSGNHGQSFNKAKKIVDAAARAGVDAIKLQTFKPDEHTLDCDNKYFQVKINKAWKGETLYSLYKKVYTPWEWQAKLKKYAESKGLICFSAPGHESAVDFLEKIKVPVYKVASFDIVDPALLKRIGRTKKPVIISRGLASVEDIKFAIKTLRSAGCPAVAVLHCISSYPAKLEQMNLLTVPDIVKRFGVVSGLSDHSLGLTASLTAVALGASIIEKHVILSRKDGGPDAEFSLEPREFKELVQSVREIEKVLGEVSYKVGKHEAQNIIFRRSLFVVENINKDEKFTKKNIRSIRPGYGLPPKELPKVLGKKATKDILRGTPLDHTLFQ
ncbi:MAG: pseudaminic acid synthase [Patescibacteria group bacterium]